MKNKLIYFKYISIIGIYFLLFSCTSEKKQKNQELPVPQIQSGIARISGKILNPPSELSMIALYYQNPVTIEQSIIETELKADGSFHFEAKVECSPILGSIQIRGIKGIIIAFAPGEETIYELKIIDNSLQVIRSTGFDLLTEEDKSNYGDAITNYIDYDSEPKPLYKMLPQEFAEYEMEVMKKRINQSFEGINLSDAAKNAVLNEMKIFHLTGRLLTYKDAMELSYLNFKDKDTLTNYVPQDPDIQYYSFLKSFDLNNPQYLYNTNNRYSILMQRMLGTEVFNIPSISETPVDEWQKGVQSTLSKLLGFDSGFFYDLLAANSYVGQLNNELQPFSDKQKENIQSYFENKEITKILFEKNEEIIQLAKEKSTLSINPTPSVPKEKLMNTIVSKYKGKAVVVDFWATWCGPCMDGMKKMYNLKQKLKDKDIVFVYISDSSSPRKLWEQKAKGIGGEHFYLTDEEWAFLRNQFEFRGIPTYLFFNAKAELKNKITGYPGTDQMQGIIEELLTP